MNLGPRIMFWDTETSPLLAAVFSLRQKYINYENVIQETFMISAAWRWGGAKKINSVSVLDDPEFNPKKISDYIVIKTLADAVNEADIIVGHNNDGFDWKVFKSMMCLHGIKPTHTPTMVDTYKWAKEFRFTSNKLDSLAKLMELDRKKENERGLWPKAALGDVRAIKNIVAYNKMDIPPLEQLYYKMKPYVIQHPNHNIWRDVECCPRCGGCNFKKDGKYFTITNVYQKYECLDEECGRYFRGTKSIKHVSLR